MGLFDGEPKTTKYRITGSVAGFIEHVINDAGIECLGARSIALHRDFHLSLGGVADMRGGDVLAVVYPKELEEFTALQELLSLYPEDMRPMLMGLSEDFVDRISYAVMDEFERQSPEFSRLKDN